MITRSCRRGQQEASFEEVAFGRFLRINSKLIEKLKTCQPKILSQGLPVNSIGDLVSTGRGVSCFNSGFVGRRLILSMGSWWFSHLMTFPARDVNCGVQLISGTHHPTSWLRARCHLAYQPGMSRPNSSVRTKVGKYKAVVSKSNMVFLYIWGK